jgi:hypothetical protein
MCYVKGKGWDVRASTIYNYVCVYSSAEDKAILSIHADPATASLNLRQNLIATMVEKRGAKEDGDVAR